MQEQRLGAVMCVVAPVGCNRRFEKPRNAAVQLLSFSLGKVFHAGNGCETPGAPTVAVLGLGTYMRGLLTCNNDHYSRPLPGPIVSLKMAMDDVDEHKCSYR